MPMENVVTALNTGLSATAMWGEVAPIVPFIVGTTLFSLAFYLVKRVINKTKRAKGGI